MILPKPNPDSARRGLKQLQKKYTMTDRTLPELMIIDDALSMINRMEDYQKELEARVRELEAQYYGLRGTGTERGNNEK